MFKPTNHFIQRWKEHFSDLDWKHEIKYSSKPGVKIKKKIKKQCPKNSYKMTVDGEQYYLINNGRTIVFVCSIDGAILTAFPYENGERKERFFGILQK